MELENKLLKEIVIEKDKRIQNLEKQVEELHRRLNKNSNNSHKPPSSDGYSKKPAFEKENAGVKGGQKGHKGDTLKMVESPDYIIPIIPLVCTCGRDITNEPGTVVEQRQVIDIPTPKVEVRSYQTYKVQCPCCQKENIGRFPEEVNAPVQYGSRIRTISVLLNNDYKVPVKKISSLLEDLYGISPNEGSIVSYNKRCYNNLETVEDQIKEKINASKVAHSDETGIRVEGKLHWLHIAATELYSYFYVHAKRGSGAILDTCSIIKDYSGTLVHDCYESYFKLTKSKHAICGAHILRELAAQAEDKKTWAILMKELLLELLHTPKEQNIKNKLQIEKIFDAIIAEGKTQEPIPTKNGKRGKIKKTKALNLLERMHKHKQSVLAYAFDPDIPFTNNLAERDLRPSKIKMKVSNTFRSFDGAKHHARITSFTSTVRKHNQNVFSALFDVFSGKKFIFAICT